MTDQLSLLPLLDDSVHPTWLLSGKPGMQNDSGVYVDNVFRFREGKLSGVNVEVELRAEGDFVLFEFSYFAGTYGVGHPLCRPCHECHRSASRSTGHGLNHQQERSPCVSVVSVTEPPRKGRLNSLKKSRAYFERHKDDPAWREHRRQVQKAWKRRKREEKEKQAA